MLSCIHLLAATGDIFHPLLQVDTISTSDEPLPAIEDSNALRMARLALLMAATVSMALGSQWAVETIYSGLAQGLGAEVVFALVAYRRYNATIAGAAVAVSFAFEWVLELFLSGHLAKGVLYNVIYLVCGMASGIVLAGILAWALTNALAKTGALDRFASGRGARELV